MYSTCQAHLPNYFQPKSAMQSIFARYVAPLRPPQAASPLLHCIFCLVWRQSLQPTFTRRCESFVTSLLHINTHFVVSYSAPSQMFVRCVASANEMNTFSHHYCLLICNTVRYCCCYYVLKLLVFRIFYSTLCSLLYIFVVVIFLF